MARQHVLCRFVVPPGARSEPRVAPVNGGSSLSVAVFNPHAEHPIRVIVARAGAETIMVRVRKMRRGARVVPSV